MPSSTILEVVLFALSSATVALCALSAYKIWRVHLMQYEMRKELSRQVDGLYAQLVTLDILQDMLGFRTRLPLTRGWAASPDFLLAIARHALARRPTVIMECSSGVSTLVLARCAELNGHGHVYSLEHSEDYAGSTRALLQQYGLEAYATVLTTPLRPLQLGKRNFQWYDTSALPQTETLDMLVVDGPPANTCPMARYPAVSVLGARLSPGGAIFIDDADRPDERRMIQQWINELPRLDHIDLHCEKGGVLLIRR